jgi:enamine deaminase RidA (YjgF/YER057c/UK114 family)
MHVREIIQPQGLWDPRPRYAQVLRSGKHAWIAGQVSVDENGSTVGEGDIEAQARQVFENVGRALESVGAGFDDVVRLHVYSTDIDAHYSTIAAFRAMHFSTPVPSTTLQVSRLVRPEWLLEIEAEVLLP